MKNLKKFNSKTIQTLLVFILTILFFSILQGCKKTKVEMLILKNATLAPSHDQTIVLTAIIKGKKKDYSLAQIESIGMKTLKTNTYWPEDDGVYEGILLKDFLKTLNSEKADSIKLTALDNYSCEILKKDWDTWPVIIATRRNGTPLSLRTKGPLRIIYPKFLGGKLDEKDRTIQWIWAIKSIEIK